MGSILGSNSVIAEDVKSYTYGCYVKCDGVKKGKALNQKRKAQLITMLSLDFQTKIMYLKGCLSAIVEI